MFATACNVSHSAGCRAAAWSSALRSFSAYSLYSSSQSFRRLRSTYSTVLSTKSSIAASTTLQSVVLSRGLHLPTALPWDSACVLRWFQFSLVDLGRTEAVVGAVHFCWRRVDLSALGPISHGDDRRHLVQRYTVPHLTSALPLVPVIEFKSNRSFPSCSPIPGPGSGVYPPNKAPQLAQQLAASVLFSPR